MSFTGKLRHLAERAQTLGEQGAVDDRQRSLLASLFRLLAHEEETDVTVEKATAPGHASFPTQPGEHAGRRAGVEEGMYLICASGVPVALACLAGPGGAGPSGRREERLSGKGPQEEAEALWSLLEDSAVRFGVLARGHCLRFYARFGEVERPVLEFDLLSHTRREVRQLKVLFRAMLTFGREEGGPLSVGRGLFYVFAVDNGEPFGERTTACKLGITGVGPESRRKAHEWRLGLQGNEELRLCYLAAGSIVAAEKPIRRKTARMAPPGLGPRSEWRWCPPRRLVEEVKETGRDQIREEGGRLGLGLAHLRLADPLTSADSPVSDDPSATPDPASRESGTPGEIGASGEVGSLGEWGQEGSSSSPSTPQGPMPGGRMPRGRMPGGRALGDRLSPEAARRRAADVKRKAVRGDLGERPGDLTLTFRTSSREDDLLRECADQSTYRGWSPYVRDQILGWNRAASIVAKSGLFVHWARAHWGREVRGEEWHRLRGLTGRFFNPGQISGEGDSGLEDSLQKVLKLARRHLLAAEPQPLQLLKGRLIKMKRFEELERITASVQDKSLGSSSWETGWAREVRRQALGVSGKEGGYQTSESIRMARAERTLATRNVRDSSYANPSSFARNYSLGWDRDVLACAWAAAVTTWLARRVGQTVGEPGWKGLEAAMDQAFDLGRLPGPSSVGGGLQAAEEHLLQAGTERVAEETGLPRP